MFCFCGKYHWNFDRGCIESVDCFGQCGHFNKINSFNLWAPNIFPFICLLQFLSSVSKNLVVGTSHLFLWLNLLCVYYLWSNVNGVVNFFPDNLLLAYRNAQIFVYIFFVSYNFTDLLLKTVFLVASLGFKVYIVSCHQQIVLFIPFWFGWLLFIFLV